MRPYAVLDLHCDTLTRSPEDGYEYRSLDDPRSFLQLSTMPRDVRWAQFYACFIPERFRGQAAVEYYDHQTDRFYRQMKIYSDRVTACETAEEIENAWKAGKQAAVYSVENGSALAGRLERVAMLRRDGVRCMSLTWNAENEIASGSDTDHGMSSFGRQAVREMEKEGILVDVSHLNDNGFRDLLEIAERPFVATHSNARSVCSHRRNLTDGMIKEMIRRSCLVGINYYTSFLKDGGENVTEDDYYAHVCRFFELGGEKILALGSDGDGCRLPDFLKTTDKVAAFADYLLSRGMTETQVENLYWRNALEFLRKNL
jgi:membrane dipeptidase